MEESETQEEASQLRVTRPCLTFNCKKVSAVPNPREPLMLEIKKPREQDAEELNKAKHSEMIKVEFVKLAVSVPEGGAT